MPTWYKRLRNLGLALASFFLASLWLPKLSPATYEIGAGMEYFTAKILARDQSDRYFHTLLQTTLAMAQLRYQQGPWLLAGSAGWSDWNASGEWQGTSIHKTTADPFLWVGQQKYQLRVIYFYEEFLGLGLQYADHSVRHYTGMTDFTYLQYHFQQLDLKAVLLLYQTQAITLDFSLAYAPWAWVTASQDTYLPADVYAIHTYQLSSQSESWGGSFNLVYRDSAGWGLELRYQLQRACFRHLDTLAEWTLTSGCLTGYLCLYF